MLQADGAVGALMGRIRQLGIDFGCPVPRIPIATEHLAIVVEKVRVEKVNPETGKIAWEIPDLGGGILASGLMSTAGGLVFYGDSPGGAFVAADATTGRLLWHFNTGQSWKAGPMTYAIDRQQFIGIAAGSTIMVFGLP